MSQGTQIKKSVVPTEYDKLTKDDLRSKFLAAFAKLLKKDDLIKKAGHGVIPRYTWDAEPKLRRPLYDYVSLVLIAQYSWPLRSVFDLIIRECTRNWGHIEPRFKLKCKACGSLFQEVLESNKCPNCGKEKLVPPDSYQKRRLEKLVKSTSPGRNFFEFVRSTLFYVLATDDFYWSVVYANIKTGKRKKTLLGNEVYVEHPGFIFPISDRLGNLGGYEYFCPVCYNKRENKGRDLFWDIRQEPEAKQKLKYFPCPQCKTPMIQTCYVQDIGGTITTRFGRNEIVHGSMSRLPPDLFGNSKLATLVKVVNTLQAIDDYQLETHTEGKIGGMLMFPSLDQDRVTEILTDVETERLKLKQRDVQSGELEPQKRSALIFVGLGTEEGKEPIKIPFLDPAEAMKTLEFYKLYIGAIEKIYGVEATISVKEKGSIKEIKTKVEVRRETAQEYQRFFMETFNESLLLLFGITDWEWIFNKLEPKDRLREAEITHTQMASAITARNAGLNVKYQDNILTIWGEALGEPKGTRTSLPNVEPGVAPRRTSREITRPFEISPETGEEITAVSTSHTERLAEQMLDILNDARERSVQGKTSLVEVLNDARTSMFRALSRSNIRLDKKEALFARFSIMLEEVLGKLASSAQKSTAFPIGWMDLTRIKIRDVTFMVEREQDELYVTANGKELRNTREDGRNFNRIISHLIEASLLYVLDSLRGTEGFKEEEFKSRIKHIIQELKREYQSSLLKDLSNYMEELGLEETAKEFDNLRSRLDKLGREPLHIEPKVPRDEFSEASRGEENE